MRTASLTRVSGTQGSYYLFSKVFSNKGTLDSELIKWLRYVFGERGVEKTSQRYYQKSEKGWYCVS